MLKIKLLNPAAKAPTRERKSAGYDLYLPEDVKLLPHGVRKIPIGIASEFMPGYVAVIKDRSSLGVKGLHVFAGVIDSDYRGEWSVVIYNATFDTLVLKAGDRIAQFLILAAPHYDIQVVPELSETARGSGGFGSTGA